MRGPGGCVLSKRLMAIAGLPDCENERMCRARPRKKGGSAAAGRRLDVVDDAFAESVDAERDERLVANRAKSMHPVRRECDRHPGLERDDPILAVQPGLAAAFQHCQYLDIGVRVQPCLIAGL